MKILALAAINLLFFSWNAQGQHTKELSPEEIVEKYAQAMGGKKAWGKVKNIQIESEVISNNETRSYSLKVMETPNKSREEIIRKGKKVIKVYDGKAGWVLNPFEIGDKFREMKPEEASNAAESEFPEALMFYKENGHRIEMYESQELGVSKVYKILLTNAKTKGKTLYFIDQGNFVLVMAISYPDDKKYPSTSYLFGNYKKIRGKLVPFVITVESLDEIKSVTTVLKVTFDVKLEDDYFSLPK